MKIREALSSIEAIAARTKCSKPYIVGGIVRDNLLGIVSGVDDIDITTGDESIYKLATETARYLKRYYPNLSYKKFPDTHSQIMVGGIKFDFSSNRQSPKVASELERAGLTNPTSLQKEIFSRDFTCNALLMTFDLKHVLDPTGMGIRDIRARILRTPLQPRITLSDDVEFKRIVRIIYLAAKLNFEVEPAIIKWVSRHPDLISRSKDQYVRNLLGKAAGYNIDKTVKLMDQMGLWQHVKALPEVLIPYATKAGRV
jgi:poly(A) polymerase